MPPPYALEGQSPDRGERGTPRRAKKKKKKNVSEELELDNDRSEGSPDGDKSWKVTKKGELDSPQVSDGCTKRGMVMGVRRGKDELEQDIKKESCSPKKNRRKELKKGGSTIRNRDLKSKRAGRRLKRSINPPGECGGDVEDDCPEEKTPEENDEPLPPCGEDEDRKYSSD